MMLTEYPMELKEKIEYDSQGKIRLKEGATEEEKKIFKEHMKLLESIENLEDIKDIKDIKTIIDY
jgi:aspartate-semialdehyde dehydrogenase